MCCEILVSFLISTVLWDTGGSFSLCFTDCLARHRQAMICKVCSQMQIFPADDDGVGHFGRLNDTGKNPATNRNISGKGAFLIDISAVDRFCDTRE